MANADFVGYDTDLLDSDQNIDALIGGWAWDISGSPVITYSFPDSAGDVTYNLGAGVNFSSGFDAAQQDGARAALDEIDKVIGVTFEEVGDDPGEDNADGTIRFFNVTGIGTAFGYYPNDGESGGDTAYSEGNYEGADMVVGTYEFHTLMHEIGHGMGLKHGHETWGPGAMNPQFDSMEYSVMTYRSYDGQDTSELPFYTNASDSYAQSLMIADIAALQRLYGADYTTNSGDTVYTFSTTTGEMFVNGAGQGTPEGNKVFRTVWDGGGEDTYDLSNYSTDLTIDLRPGGHSDFDRGGNFQRAELNFGIGYVDGEYVYSSDYEVWADGHLYNALMYEGDQSSLIENAIGGSGDDILRGNQVGNNLDGRAGTDILFGGQGDDILTGGAGNDLFVFSFGMDSDTVTDFGDGDLLDFTAYGVDTRLDLVRNRDRLSEQDGDAVITLVGGDQLVLDGVSADSIGFNDFLLT